MDTRKNRTVLRLLYLAVFTGVFSALSGQVPVGNGSGNFHPPLVIPVSDNPLKMMPGDLNQDSIPDLVVGTDSAQGVQILIGNGDGSFDLTQVPSVTIAEELEEMFLGQFDADGLLDLLMLASDSGNFYLLRGLGSGALQVPELIYQYSDPVTAVKLADLNGDGHEDVVVSSLCGIVGCVNTRILFSDGAGGLILSPQDFPVSSAVEFADLDGDADLDLLLAGNGFAVIGTYLNDGSGDFTLVQEVVAGVSFLKILAVDVMSVDDDGIPSSGPDGLLDIVGLPEFSESLLFFVGVGGGSYLDPITGYADGEISSVGDMFAAQLDGFGTPELLYYSYGPDRLTVLHGDGTNGFPYESSSTYDLPSNPSCMRISDFDSDGVLDLAVASLSDDSISVFLGEESQEQFIRGDVNNNQMINIADPVYLLELLFLSGGALDGCLDAFDANDSGELDISDPVFLLQYLFDGGDVVPLPFPDCGIDPTADTLNCLLPVNSPCP